MTTEFDEAKWTFQVEAEELLTAMENALLFLETNPTDAESINAVFRAAHTIKGTAGIFGFDDVVNFTHVVETLLDKVRDGEATINEKIIAALLKSSDHMLELVIHVIQESESITEEMQHTSSDLITLLNTFILDKPIEVVTADASVVENIEEEQVHSLTDSWHISLRFGLDVLKQGMDPKSFIKYLQQIGEIVSLTMLPDKIPSLSDIDAENCYLGFEIDLLTEQNKQEIEDVFEFVQEDCQIRILPSRSAIQSYIDLIKELPEEESLLGELLIKSKTLTQKELEDALLYQQQQQDVGSNKALGEILVGQGIVDEKVVGAGVAKQKSVKGKIKAESSIVRVKSEKLDKLINMVGEMVIASASASLLAQQSNNSALEESTSLVNDLVDGIRDSALALRMVPIGETFNKFQRVTRDVSHDLGKEVELIITGADTELDKMVVEKIGDPLMHLLRNALDHGLELPKARIASQKSAQGKIHLNAFHDSGNIVIEIKDDGIGLNKSRILEKAIAKNIIDVDHELTENEIYNLIFEPGFSTAASVTNLSGRGVGMDVVRRNIIALRGTVELTSEEGYGTMVQIRLPLTLAIIDGFIVGIDDDTYVVPLDMVIECVDYDEYVNPSEGEDCDFLNLRGEVLPLVRLKEHFDYQQLTACQNRKNVVVVHYANYKAGLVVDKLLGEFQTVIKPLGKIFSQLKGISGSTILGSGEVSLILDVPQLVLDASNKELKRAS